MNERCHCPFCHPHSSWSIRSPVLVRKVPLWASGYVVPSQGWRSLANSTHAGSWRRHRQGQWSLVPWASHPGRCGFGPMTPFRAKKEKKGQRQSQLGKDPSEGQNSRKVWKHRQQWLQRLWSRCFLGLLQDDRKLREHVGSPEAQTLFPSFLPAYPSRPNSN